MTAHRRYSLLQIIFHKDLSSPVWYCTLCNVSRICKKICRINKPVRKSSFIKSQVKVISRYLSEFVPCLGSILSTHKDPADLRPERILEFLNSPSITQLRLLCRKNKLPLIQGSRPCNCKAKVTNYEWVSSRNLKKENQNPSFLSKREGKPDSTTRPKATGKQLSSMLLREIPGVLVPCISHCRAKRFSKMKRWTSIQMYSIHSMRKSW